MWFAVPIYLRSSEPVEGEVLLQETIHLVEAESEEGAMLKARALGDKLEHRYINVIGEEVCWSLDEIGEPWELLDNLGDGAEVYSRFIGERIKKALREK
jgi:hypothetical protein